ncbi:Ribonuclease/ribotoxin [Colletotrichum navitas]|uniref:ribonuclease T1 n=1 Tax=Colletotrichum navitas TaxID=681940 RepID=A0AAD8PYF4_9PEZI|nr:Ribonuclease/ribotoxin [Colletotrichum navitas]KAK1589823.1 Ribonuclease/ribotoxin [Colletotrichum navitas]
MQLLLVLVSLFALVAQAVSPKPVAPAVPPKPVAPAVPAERLQKRSITCGSTTYSAAQVNAASNAACNHVRAGTVTRRTPYPHRYDNNEGFNFQVPGPYYEFPLKASGIYHGRNPGPDRVIINASCEQAGQVTHQGSTGSGFVGCSGTS